MKDAQLLRRVVRALDGEPVLVVRLSLVRALGLHEALIAQKLANIAAARLEENPADECWVRGGATRWEKWLPTVARGTVEGALARLLERGVVERSQPGGGGTPYHWRIDAETFALAATEAEGGDGNLPKIRQVANLPKTEQVPAQNCTGTCLNLDRFDGVYKESCTSLNLDMPADPETGSPDPSQAEAKSPEGESQQAGTPAATRGSGPAATGDIALGLAEAVCAIVTEETRPETIHGAPLVIAQKRRRNPGAVAAGIRAALAQGLQADEVVPLIRWVAASGFWRPQLAEMPALCKGGWWLNIVNYYRNAQGRQAGTPAATRAEEERLFCTPVNLREGEPDPGGAA